MTAPIYSLEEFLGALQNLLPQGRAWSIERQSVQARLEAGLISAFQRVNVSDAELLEDAFPATAHFLLPEWEAALGLPDPCAGPAPTIAERQAQVVAKLTDGGGQSADRFIELAGILGYTVTVTSFAPFRSGVSHSGDELGEPGAYFLWQVNAPSTTSLFFLAGGGHSGDELQTFGNDVLECSIRGRAPAHTTVRFTYGAEYAFLEEGFGSHVPSDFHYVRPVGGSPTVGSFASLWTVSRGSSAMYRDSTGIYRYANENQLVRSGELDNGTWVKVGLNAVTANASTDADGNATADLITEDTSIGQHYVEQFIAVVTGGRNPAGAKVQTSFARVRAAGRTKGRLWMAGASGSAACDFDLVALTAVPIAPSGNGLSLSAGVESLGNGLFEVHVTGIADQTSGTGVAVRVSLCDASGALSYVGNGTSGMYVAGIQCQSGAHKGAYLTTGAAVKFDQPRFNHNPVDNVRRLLLEPFSEAMCLWSRDLRRPGWGATNMTVARTATGVDGVPNTACRLTATANGATILQPSTTSNVAKRFTPFMRRVSGVGAVDITLDNISWTTQTLTSQWQRVTGISQTLANHTNGIRLATSGDVIEVDFVTVEACDYDTSPLEAFAAPVQRQGDDITRTFGAEYDTAEGAFICKGIIPTTNMTVGYRIFSRDANSRHLQLTGSPAVVSVNDGTNVTPASAALAANTSFKAASGFGALHNTCRLSLNGAAVLGGPYDGSWGAGTSMRLGNPNGGAQRGCELEWFFYLPVEPTDTWLRSQTG